MAITLAEKVVDAVLTTLTHNDMLLDVDDTNSLLAREQCLSVVEQMLELDRQGR